MDALIARALALAPKLWARLLSPSMVRLLAPLLAAGVVLAGYLAWRRAGDNAIGRRLRWWALAVPCAAVLAATLYLLAATPGDPDVLAALRAEPAQPWRATLPAPLALAGALTCAGAALWATWTWRVAGLPPAARQQEAVAWRSWWRRHRRPAIVLVTLPLAALLTAGAAGAALPGATPTSPSARGRLWIGTPVGVSHLDLAPDGAAWGAFVKPRAPLPGGRVNALAATPDGALWVASTRGLTRLAPSAGGLEWTTYDAGNSALPSPQVLGVVSDGDGAAWAATAAGGATIHPTDADRTFTGRNAPLLHTILDTAWVDRSGQVWFGGAGGVNVYRPPPAGAGRVPGGGSPSGAGPAGDLAGAASPDGDWVVGFTRFSTGGGLPDDLVYAILEDAHGRLWFGTSGGVGVFSPDRAVFALGAYDATRWQTFTTRTSPLADDRVHAIAEDRQGRIWLGTEGGLSVVTLPPGGPAAGQWQRFDASGAVAPGAAGAAGASTPSTGKAGLPHPWVRALAMGPDGRVWAGTRGGLAVYDLAQPGQGWQVYRASALHRWLGYLWPGFWRRHVLDDDITALAWTGR